MASGGPTTFSRLLLWFSCHLSRLPSHVAGVPVGLLRRESCGRSWRRRETAPCIPLLVRRLVAEVLGGVVSSRAGRPVVVFVRLLLVLRIAQWEEMKNFVSTEPSAFQKL